MGDELRIYELQATGFAGFDSEPTLELPTLRKGAPDPAEWLQFCVYYFFIAFNCLTLSLRLYTYVYMKF